MDYTDRLDQIDQAASEMEALDAKYERRFGPIPRPTPRQFRVSYSGAIIYVNGFRKSPSPLATKVLQAILETIGQPRDTEGVIVVDTAGGFSFQEAV